MNWCIKLKFNGEFEHGSNSCEMCQNNPFYFGIQWIAWWDYSQNLSFIWNFYLKAKTWNILGFNNSWYRIYLTHHSHGAVLGESVCISLLYCGECILAAHVLSECVTVAFLWGIAKIIVVIWYLANNWQDLVMFRCRCLTSWASDHWVASSNPLRGKFRHWFRLIIPGVCLAQFSLNNVHKRGLKHHHFQRAIWKASFDGDPLVLNPVHYRWSSDVASDMLLLVPPDIPPAAVEILQMVRCGCSTWIFYTPMFYSARQLLCSTALFFHVLYSTC